MNILYTIIKKAINKAIPSNNNILASDYKILQEDADLYSRLKYCRQEIQQSEASGIMPSPKYFEQVAVLSRKEKKFEDEIAICNYYIKAISHFAAKNNFSKTEFNKKAFCKIDPFRKRINLAKTMLVNTSSGKVAQ